MNKKLKFTIYHGFAMSLVLHSAVGLPFVVRGLQTSPDEPSMLDLELQGAVADSQTEQKVLQQTKGAAQADEPEKPKKLDDTAKVTAQSEPKDETPEDREGAPPPPEAQADPMPKPPTEETKSANSNGTQNVSGGAEQQAAQTIKIDPGEINRYGKLLSKKVQANLVYPDDGRQARLQGAAKVSFTILSSGQIQPDSLRIVESSGQPKLDASALKTIRSSVPFDPPPKEMRVAIAVVYGRKP